QGKQIRLFGDSIRARMLGEPIPEGGYSGDYVTEIATEALATGLPSDSERLAAFGIAWVRTRIEHDLGRLGIRHDNWFYEHTLYEGINVQVIDRLRGLGRIVEKDGATWFRSDTGKDEVVIRRDGYPTYFASDIFYHYDKFVLRRFDRVVDVWGADHQGQVGRVKEALSVLGIEPDRLNVLLVQLV